MSIKEQSQYLTTVNINSIKTHLIKLIENTEKELLQLNDALLLNIYGLSDDIQAIELQYIKNTIDKVLAGIYEATNFNRLASQSYQHFD